MFSLDRFVEGCRAALAYDDPPSRIRKLVRQEITEPRPLAGALGLLEAAAGTIAQYAVLYQSPELTVMHVVTPPGLRSPPHNHLAWAVIGMYRGCERNTFYRRDGRTLAETGTRELAAPDTLALPSDAIHAISNPLDRASYALHVYGGSLANPARSLWDPFTRREQPFELAAMARFEEAMSGPPPAAGV